MPSKIKLFLFRLKTENMTGSIVNLDARASRPEIRHAYLTAAQARACGKRTVIHLLSALKLNRAREFFFDNTTTARPFIADGRVKPYVTSGSVRDALLPNVPTAAVIERLRAATLEALQNPDVRRRLEANGWRILSMSPDEMRLFVKREAQKWPALLREAGIRPE